MRAPISAVVRFVARRTRGTLTTAAELAGGLLIARGVGELHHAAGLIVGGIELVLLGWLEAPTPTKGAK